MKREIFAITGLPPEMLAVAMAKYSRSPESIKDTIDELTEEKSAEFHEKWVLGYGDASVADMAVIPVALENISILASKVVEDNRLASYQEKSTRYQPFSIERFFVPEDVKTSNEAQPIYHNGIQELMTAYQTVIDRMIIFYQEHYPKPEAMKDKAYANKCRARALDIARYLLPTATLTNFGMVANARSLRHCISKLLAHPLKEMNDIGKELEFAATHPSYNPQLKKIEPILKELLDSTTNPHLAETLKTQLTLQVKGAPTLVNFTQPKAYLMKKRETMRRWAKELQSTFDNAQLTSTSNVNGQMSNVPARVDYLTEHIALEDELVASLLYPEATMNFRAILENVKELPQETKRAIIESVQKERGQYDGVSREFEVGQGLIFDTLFDYGAFRDLQRHRMMTQLNQELSCDHGYELPRDIDETGLTPLFKETLERNRANVEALRSLVGQSSQYLIALAWKKRTLMKMNLRELYHLVELRTKSGGHFSYRDLCYEMYKKIKAAHPLLVADLRAVKPNFPNEFFER